MNNRTTPFTANVTVPTDRIAALCKKHHIARLFLFGSVIHDDFSPDSDVDVLVEFEPGMTPGLRFFTIQDDLTQLFGRRVDLNTPESLSSYFRDKVEAEAVPLYVQP
jgi:predicted nucleotidyltransferase